MSAPDQDVTTKPGAPDRDEGQQPAPDPNFTTNLRLQHTQAQVDEVVDIMHETAEKLIDRDKKLSELDDRADALHSGAMQFESSAAKLKNKYWWKNFKMMIIMGIVLVLLVAIAFMYFYH
ncbi:vesicle associated membrane protein 1a [Hemibagrus wyckioides]|nr:vesicle associated membrane protein 1a [Hemibagrus wyckioides]